MKMVQHSFGAEERPGSKDSEARGQSATLCPRHRSGIDSGARRWRPWLSAVLCLLAVSVASLPACGGSWQGSIGALLAKDNKDGRLYVRETPPDMGAARAGLEPGDEIVAIEGKPARDLSADQVHQALHGDVGTKVSLTISRRGVERTLQVERGPLKSPDAGA